MTGLPIYYIQNGGSEISFHFVILLQVMVTNVTSLLKTVKIIEDEHQRGTRALEAAIEAIGQEISLYDSGEAPSRGNTSV